MKRMNFLKAMICVAMFTLMLGTTAMAGTVSRSKNVRGVTSYTDTYQGAYGSYCAASDGTYATTSVQNTSGYSRLFRCSAIRYNYNTGTYDLTDDGSKVLTNGNTTKAQIRRDKASYVYNYEHYVNAFYSTSGTSSTMVDSYSFVAKQYYE